MNSYARNWIEIGKERSRKERLALVTVDEIWRNSFSGWRDVLWGRGRSFSFSLKKYECMKKDVIYFYEAIMWYYKIRECFKSFNKQYENSVHLCTLRRISILSFPKDNLVLLVFWFLICICCLSLRLLQQTVAASAVIHEDALHLVLSTFALSAESGAGDEFP